MTKSFFTFLFCLAIIAASKAEISIKKAFPALSFQRPVDVQHAPGDASRLFVVEQAGRIYIFENRATVQQKSLFLDISHRVNDSGNEEGLLGLAFHPDFANNGRFFVDYTAADPRRTVIAEFTLDGTDPNRADPASERIILEINQPFSNHNGGQIAFGPDGYLYIAFGDGGSGGDPLGHGQNRQTLLGAIVRIDVDHTDDNRHYAIPPDNPFAGNDKGYREEIWAWGLRNPWRFSFDSKTGDLWAADVGQNAWEEIDLIAPGVNYGWNVMEGLHCYNANSCDTTGLAMPVWEYGHDVGRSITGGFVYRGRRLPGLVGKYIYADFVTGRIWALKSGGNEVMNELLLDTSLQISSFGVDANQGLYLLAFNGSVYQLVDESAGVSDQRVVPASFTVYGNYPNPFNSTTMLNFELATSTAVSVDIFATTGRRVWCKTALFSAGRHAIPWRAVDDSGVPLPSGLYIARFTTATLIVYEKMMLIR